MVATRSQRATAPAARDPALASENSRTQTEETLNKDTTRAHDAPRSSQRASPRGSTPAEADSIVVSEIPTASANADLAERVQLRREELAMQREELAIRQQIDEIDARKEARGMVENPTPAEDTTTPVHDHPAASEISTTIAKSYKRQRCGSESSGTSSGGDFQVRNLPVLKTPTTSRKREEWIDDLERAHEAAARRFKQDRKKILLALDQLDTEGRVRYRAYLNETDKEDIQNIKNDWDAFKKWTLSLIRNSEVGDLALTISLVEARQRKSQPPNAFHTYLDSLEKNFDHESETQRALNFLARLQPSLREHIKSRASNLPETRDQMVTLATECWESMKQENKRKQDDNSQAGSSKTSRVSTHYSSPYRTPSYRGSSYKGSAGYTSSPGYRVSSAYRGSSYRSGSRGRPYQRYDSVRPKSNSYESSNQDSGVPTCYNCGNDGHRSPDCDYRTTRTEPEGDEDQDARAGGRARY